MTLKLLPHHDESYDIQATLYRGWHHCEEISFVGFDFLGGADLFPPLLRDIVTEGNENFERVKSENCCSENLEVKYERAH